MKPTPAKLTYDDFLGFPDDGHRHELIDGEHYVTPSPSTIHQRLVSRLHGALFAYLQGHPVGEVFTAPFDVLLSPHDVVEPDVLVVRAEQSEIVTEAHVRGAPAIVVEVVSPGTRRRDEELKRQLYERAGVEEYWLVDPDTRSVTRWNRAPDGTLQVDAKLDSAADLLTSPILSGFSLRLSDLFPQTWT